jgi:hypothetical protein
MKIKSSARKTAPTSESTVPGLSDLGQLLPALEMLHRDIHSHPELSIT